MLPGGKPSALSLPADPARAFYGPNDEYFERRAHSSPPISKFAIMPKGAKFSRSGALRRGGFHELKVLRERGFPLPLAMRGIRAGTFVGRRRTQSIAKAARRAGYNWANRFLSRSMPPHLSSTIAHKIFMFLKTDGSKRTAEELIEYYAQLCAKFPIISIEDGCAENDWTGWKKLTQRLGEKSSLSAMFICERGVLRKGIDEHIANSILLRSTRSGRWKRSM